MPLKVGALDHLVINVESVTVSAELSVYCRDPDGNLVEISSYL